MPERDYYEILSPSNPLTMTFWPNAWSTDEDASATVTFNTFEELKAFFNRYEVLRRPDKRSVPLFSRGYCEGPRKKDNHRPPYLLLLDIDQSEVDLEECCHRLDELCVRHVAYSTWSHPDKPRNSYRILTDMLVDSWESLEVLTRILFEDLGFHEPGGPASSADRASWDTISFFVPATRTDS